VLLVAICNIVTLFCSYYMLGALFANIDKQIPEMKLSNGSLSITGQTEPIYIKYNDRIVSIIDTKSSVEKHIDSRVPIIITNSEILMFDGENSYYSALSFSSYSAKDVIINKNFLETVKNYFIWITFLVFYPLVLLIWILLLSLSSSAFSLFGILYGKITKASLNFKRVFHVAIVATFPVLILDTALSLYFFLSNDFFFDVLYKTNSSLKQNAIFLIAIGYFFSALKTICTKINGISSSK